MASRGTFASVYHMGSATFEAQQDRKRREIERKQRDKEVLWRTDDYAFIELQRGWRLVDDKRGRVQERGGQLALMARISGYMALALLTVYVNQNVPEADMPESARRETLLMCWGLLSIVCVVLHLTVMLLATIMNVAILERSAQEDATDNLRDVRRLIDRDSAEGAEELALGAAAMTPFQLEAVWRREYDRWFRRLVLLFSAGIPLSLAVFTPLALIKLPRCPACAWAVGCSSITGLAVWLRFHLSMVSHILWASERDIGTVAAPRHNIAREELPWGAGRSRLSAREEARRGAQPLAAVREDLSSSSGSLQGSPPSPPPAPAARAAPGPAGEGGVQRWGACGPAGGVRGPSAGAAADWEHAHVAV